MQVETINMDDSDDEGVDTNEQVDRISNLLGSDRFREHMQVHMGCVLSVPCNRPTSRRYPV